MRETDYGKFRKKVLKAIERKCERWHVDIRDYVPQSVLEEDVLVHEKLRYHFSERETEATSAQPGTADKQAILAARVAAGQSLFHPDDTTLAATPSDLARVGHRIMEPCKVVLVFGDDEDPRTEDEEEKLPHTPKR